MRSLADLDMPGRVGTGRARLGWAGLGREPRSLPNVTLQLNDYRHPTCQAFLNLLPNLRRTAVVLGHVTERGIPMFDLVEHVPIKNSKAKILQLQELAMDSVCERATSLQFRIAGDFTFRVIELPLSSYLECRVPVESLALEDLVLERLKGGRI